MADMVTVAVVGHVARQNTAHRLARRTGGRLFLDNGTLGEWANHRRAWMWCATQPEPWSLVLQDDAVPVPAMVETLTDGLTHLPSEGLVSLYLGTGYPGRWQTRIARATSGAGAASWLQSAHLLHGVAVAAPTAWVAGMVAPTSVSHPYDEQLSRWCRDNHRPVFYTWPSLVDHADMGTLVDHGTPRTRPRRAWRTGTPEWNADTVELV